MQLTDLVFIISVISKSQGIRIAATLIYPTQLKISCFFDDASSDMIKIYRLHENNENVTVSVQTGPNCELFTSLSEKIVQCVCLSPNQVDCYITSPSIGDRWKCATFQHGKPVYSDIANVIAQERIEGSNTTTTGLMSTRKSIIDAKTTSLIDRKSLATTFAFDDEEKTTEMKVSMTPDRTVSYLKTTYEYSLLKNVTNTSITLMNLTTGTWEIDTNENHTYTKSQKISTRLLIIIVGVVGSSIVLAPMILAGLCQVCRIRSGNTPVVNNVEVTTIPDNVIIEAIPPDTIRASVNLYDTISLMSFPTIAESANMFILANTDIEDTTASVHYYEWVPDVFGEGAVSNDMSEPSEQQIRTNPFNYESLQRTRASHMSDYSNLESNLFNG